MTATGSLAALKIETRSEELGRELTPLLASWSASAEGCCRASRCGTPITHGLTVGGAFRAFVRHSLCAASHQRRRRIDLGPGGRVPHVAGVPRWTASALHQGRATRWRLSVTHASSFPYWWATWCAWECRSALALGIRGGLRSSTDRPSVPLGARHSGRWNGWAARGLHF